MLAYTIDIAPNGIQTWWSNYTHALLCQHFIIYTAFTIFIVLLATILLSTVTTNFNNFQVFYNVLNVFNLVLVSFLFIFIFINFIISVSFFNQHATAISTLAENAVSLNYIIPTVTFNMNGSVLSDIILLLAFSSGMVCLYLLGEKNLANYIANSSFFIYFFLTITVMVYTTNLLVMFIGFELLFLPTLYFVFAHAYVERNDKSLRILIYWTLGGAFLVLMSLAYLYYKYNTLSFYTLCQVTFTETENMMLFSAIFIGFGVNMPVFPFHYWLTNIHVEAPAGFSIFLSGFLVNAALYCFYFFNLIFQTPTSVQVVTVVAIFGVAESSINMWNQTDFNNLVAFATIQEMNLILILLVNTSNTLNYGLILFILIHGWLSTLMFFTVDVIQNNTNTRNLILLSGLAYNFPAIKWVIWLILILFTGFPLTVNFSIEWQILATLLLQSQYVALVVFFIVLVIGTVGFANQMFILLYGMPRNDLNINNQLSSRDNYLFYFICGILIFLNVIQFFLG